MIVGDYFKGDDATKIAWRQHDVYGEALSIIVDTCNRYAKFARIVLNDRDHPEWGTFTSYDHRTLQLGHDLLAAAWRFRSDCQQIKLPLAEEEDTIETLWLNWLRNEMSSWIEAPHLIGLIQIILANQNQHDGKNAESTLAWELIQRFSDVTWKKNWIEAIEQDYLNINETPLDQDEEETEKDPFPFSCDCVAIGKRPCGQIPCKTTCETAEREGWGPLE